MEQLGWIQLHRKFMDWEWYTDTNTKVLFIHCLLKANHKDAKWRGHTIKRGQFLSSLNHLATDTGLSVRNIRTSLKHLESTGDVTREATHQLTKLTICNYDTYNNLKSSSDTPSDKRPTHDRHTGDNKQECKEQEEQKEIRLERFEKAWKDFGRHGTKAKAKSYWLKLSDPQMEEIEIAIPEYLQHLKENDWQRKKNFEGWINPKNQYWTNTGNRSVPNQKNNFNSAIQEAMLQELKDFS